jgi:hypothetical protein
MKSMGERFTCPQGHQWDDAHWTGTQRNLCPYCGAEPASPTAIETADAPRLQRKPAPAEEDLPSVLAAEPSQPARPKSTRGVGSLAVLGCLFFVLAVVALLIGGGGWYYYSARQFEMRRARSVAERNLTDEYQDHWRIEIESMSPGLTQAAFEGKADPGGFGTFSRRFTIILSKYNDGRWHVDQ